MPSLSASRKPFLRERASSGRWPRRPAASKTASVTPARTMSTKSPKWIPSASDQFPSCLLPDYSLREHWVYKGGIRKLKKRGSDHTSSLATFFCGARIRRNAMPKQIFCLLPALTLCVLLAQPARAQEAQQQGAAAKPDSPEVQAHIQRAKQIAGTYWAQAEHFLCESPRANQATDPGPVKLFDNFWAIPGSYSV